MHKSWVPVYARDEVFQAHVGTKSYLQDRIHDLSNKVRTLPRQYFLKSSSDHHAVFYNVFVPKDNEAGVFRLMINNQMRGVYASLYSKDPVYYNPIGLNTTCPICRPRQTCHQLRYMEEGGEVDTLQHMYEYCLERPHDTVVCLHDKESFRSNPSNARIRRLATKAALSPECYNMAATSETGGGNVTTSCDQCNVCSLNFNFVHHHYSSGNMFSAKCSYISTLIPPKDFEMKRLQMFRRMQLDRSVSDQFSCFRECILDAGSGSNHHHTEVEYSKLLGIGRCSYET